MKGIKGQYKDYQCSNGHYATSPWPVAQVLKQGCLVYVRGKPCTGTLKRVGTGSTKDNKEHAT